MDLKEDFQLYHVYVPSNTVQLVNINFCHDTSENAPAVLSKHQEMLQHVTFPAVHLEQPVCEPQVNADEK